MAIGRDEIIDAALKLPDAERLLIAVRLLDTLPDDGSDLLEDDTELIRELERRADDKETTIPTSDLWKQD